MTEVTLGIAGKNEAAKPAQMLEDLYNHLLNNQFIVGNLSSKFNFAEARRTGKPLQKLWQLTGLSANDFADEVARFFVLPRVSLPDLMVAASLVDRFSQRFLGKRPYLLMPKVREVRGWSSRTQPTRRLSVRQKSFSAARSKSKWHRSKTSQRSSLRGWKIGRQSRTPMMLCLRAPPTTSRVCATSRAAPRWSARSTIYLNARSNCAPPTSISNLSSRGLIVRMRVDGLLLRTIPTPAGALAAGAHFAR